MKTVRKRKTAANEFDDLCNVKIGRLPEDFNEGFTRGLVDTEDKDYTGLYYRVS